MSKYSLSSDLRDLLLLQFRDDWEEFKRQTGGLLYKIDEYGQIVLLHIKCPAELIPYYPYTVEKCTVGDNCTEILLSKESRIDSVIDNMEDLNCSYGIRNKFEPFNTDCLRQMKAELTQLYEESLKKNISNIV